MKSIIVAALSLAAVALPTAASAQRWESINARQDRLEMRIERGIRSGALTRPEATRLRTESRQIARLEARYRANGLSAGERRDLQRRFDALDARVRWEKHDRQDRRYRG